MVMAANYTVHGSENGTIMSGNNQDPKKRLVDVDVSEIGESTVPWSDESVSLGYTVEVIDKA